MVATTFLAGAIVARTFTVVQSTLEAWIAIAFRGDRYVDFV
jgi:hypothetical protein